MEKRQKHLIYARQCNQWERAWLCREWTLYSLILRLVRLIAVCIKQFFQWFSSTLLLTTEIMHNYAWLIVVNCHYFTTETSQSKHFKIIVSCNRLHRHVHGNTEYFINLILNNAYIYITYRPTHECDQGGVTCIFIRCGENGRICIWMHRNIINNNYGTGSNFHDYKCIFLRLFLSSISYTVSTKVSQVFFYCNF